MPLKSHVGTSAYVHLLDGGLYDNTGLKTVLEIVEARGGIIGTAKAARMRGIKKRVFIIVNAATAPELPEDNNPDTPGMYRQMRALIDIPIDLHSSISMDQLRGSVARWKSEVRNATPEERAGTLDPDVEFYIIEVNLSAAQEMPGMLNLQNIPVTLTIAPHEIAALKAFARAELFNAPQWKQLLEDIAQRP
ncbi:MAG: hypothetical protein ACREX0_19745 [Noviherbaspirillum sp.]